MNPGSLSARVVSDRLNLVDEMLDGVRSLPLHSDEAFFADPRNAWSAESCLRRSLEALFDAGRHILAQAFGSGVSEYREVAERLGQVGVLLAPEADIMRVLAGYRNRMVHYDHEMPAEELYAICAQQLGDIETVRDGLRRWLRPRLVG